MSAAVRLAGTLDLRAATDDPIAALAAAVAQWWRQDADLDDVLAAFRPAPLLVEVDQDQQLSAVRTEGLLWLPVFTGLKEFAAWMQACGRGAETIGYGCISGAELLDDALPQLPAGTGMVLNPGHARVMALPPVPPVVPADTTPPHQES